MATMKAVRIHQYGGREVLSYEDAPSPVFAKDEVLIRVTATSVNPFDWAVRNGYMTNYYNYPLPHILGLDVSGVVEAVGAEVKDISIGDGVFARANPAKNGAYASYISLPASAVARKPQTLDLLSSAAVPHAAASAWAALVDVAHLTAGQTVFILGAAGGVGTFAVQLAKHLGARVIGTCSAQNMEFLKSLGADQVIDYNAVRFEDVVHDVDIVIDLVGDMIDNSQQRSWKTIKPGGILASLVQFPSQEAAAEHHVRGSFVNVENCDGKFLAEISALIDGGHLYPVISATHMLTEIKLAHEQSENRHVRGKIVLQVAET